VELLSQRRTATCCIEHLSGRIRRKPGPTRCRLRSWGGASTPSSWMENWEKGAESWPPRR